MKKTPLIALCFITASALVFGFVQMEQAKKSANALDRTIVLAERAIQQVEVEKAKAFQAMQEAQRQRAISSQSLEDALKIAQLEHDRNNK